MNTQKNEWIPITRELPKVQDEYYIVCVKNKNKEDWIYIIDFAYFSEWDWRRTNTWENITHWMMLPLPPN